jgi:hypothetical protein
MTTQKCPKCGSETDNYAEYPVLRCFKCAHIFSSEQQNTIDNQKNVIKRLQDEEEFCEKEIDRLRGVLGEIEVRCSTDEVSCGPRIIAEIARKGLEGK